METTTKQKVEITTENINNVLELIKVYADKKKFVINGALKFNGFTSEFPSLSAKKYFRNALNRVTHYQTMRTANIFLSLLKKYSDCTAKVEYSEKELAIIDKRKKWKEAKAIAEKLMAEYKNEKGDYYKQI